MWEALLKARKIRKTLAPKNMAGKGQRRLPQGQGRTTVTGQREAKMEKDLNSKVYVGQIDSVVRCCQSQRNMGKRRTPKATVELLWTY